MQLKKPLIPPVGGVAPGRALVPSMMCCGGTRAGQGARHRKHSTQHVHAQPAAQAHILCSWGRHLARQAPVVHALAAPEDLRAHDEAAARDVQLLRAHGLSPARHMRATVTASSCSSPNTLKACPMTCKRHAPRQTWDHAKDVGIMRNYRTKDTVRTSSALPSAYTSALSKLRTVQGTVGRTCFGPCPWPQLCSAAQQEAGARGSSNSKGKRNKERAHKFTPASKHCFSSFLASGTPTWLPKVTCARLVAAHAHTSRHA